MQYIVAGTYQQASDYAREHNITHWRYVSLSAMLQEREMVDVTDRFINKEQHTNEY